MLGRATRHRGQRAIVAALGDPFFYTTGLPAGVSSPLASQIDSATPGPNRQCCLNRIIPAGKYGCVLRRSSQLFARTSLTDQRRYNTCGQSTFAMLTRRAAVDEVAAVTNIRVRRHTLRKSSPLFFVVVS